jgi:TetR/AcrR family transcriptional regulator, ethionamide resistance regulator
MRAAVELSPSVPQIEACWQDAIAAAGSATLASMTERYFYRASKQGTSLTDAAQTLTHIWLAILPS